jgi:hypothetical protein
MELGTWLQPMFMQVQILSHGLDTGENMRQIALIVCKDESRDHVFDQRVFVSNLTKEPVEDNPNSFRYKVHLCEDIFSSYTVNINNLSEFQDFLYKNFGIITMPHIGAEYEVELSIISETNEKIKSAISDAENKKNSENSVDE